MKTRFTKTMTGVAIVTAIGLFVTGCLAGDYSYKRVPKEVHQTNFLKGHDGSKDCFYHEAEAVFFCQY